MIEIHRISDAYAEQVASMVGELLEEIMQEIGSRAFDFDLDATLDRLRVFIADGIYDGFVATATGVPAGFVTAYQSHSLYANGAYGTIPELYVRPQYRSQGTGGKLLNAIAEAGREKGWTRLEVTTPPIPEFDRTLEFYQRSGFAISGGRKLQFDLRLKDA